MSTERIADLNDRLRRTFQGGRVMTTPGIRAFPEEDQAAIFAMVQGWGTFTEDNDPHGERDFGAFVHGGHKIFWKIDYYDRSLRFGSEDPADPAVTTRVLTILLAEEY